jgi:nicotinamidase/pyrazinamidase
LSDQEAYSGFAGTDLARRLRQAGVTRLFIGGLATDYCVLNTVADALDEGFNVVLLVDAVRAVDVQPNDGERAVARMSALGAIVAGLGEVQP